MPNADGTYTIELPQDPSTLGDLIAWIDTDDDNKFDLDTESGYFAVKEIDGTQYAIGFGYFGNIYLISYGGSQNTDIGIIGYSGYHFTLD